MTQLSPALGLAAAIALAALPAAAQTPAAQPAATATVNPAEVVVAPDAPPGSSGDVAKGAMIGLAVGLVLVFLLGASASTE